MSREIKFRAWDYYSGMKYNPSVSDGTDGGETSRVCLNSALDDFDGVLMQYTGLKDKNGVDIYEGDIVILDNNWDSFSFNAGEKMEVCFNDGSFVIRHKEFKNKYYTISDSLNEIEVIGNIHEHPHLLENVNENIY